MTKVLIDTVRTLPEPRQPATSLKPKSSPSQPRPASAPPPASVRPPPSSEFHGVDHPVHIPPGVAAAVVQPIAFMPSLPPPRRAAPVAPVESPAEPPARSATGGTLVPVLLVAILIAIGALAFVMWQRSAPSAERSTAAPSSAISEDVTATATTESSAAAAAPTATATASAIPSASALPEASAAASESAAPEPVAPGGQATPPVGKALVSFECSPARCDSVFCDGHAVPDIFQPVPLRAGRHTCKALKQGYRSLSQTFSVHSGDSVTRTFPQEKRVETKSKYRTINKL
jgi:hypothetical protein